MENITDTQEPEKEKSEAPSGQQYWWQNPLILTLLFAFIVGIFHFFFNRKKSKEVQIEKRVLYEMYGIDKKTLAKWINIFCCKYDFQFEYYKNKRKLPKSEFDEIVAILGEPCAETPVMNKKQIVTLTEASYESLRDCIIKYPQKMGISIEVYDSLSRFPPSISKHIIKHFG
jgi:hypothetical protein